MRVRLSVGNWESSGNKRTSRLPSPRMILSWITLYTNKSYCVQLALR